MFGVICDARKGRDLGVNYLALVDRGRSKALWWTSDNARIAISYSSREAAEFAASRLKMNRARVVPFHEVRRLLSAQASLTQSWAEECERRKDHQEAMNATELGWDAHKSAP